jgi:hypothetical protein
MLKLMKHTVEFLNSVLFIGLYKNLLQHAVLFQCLLEMTNKFTSTHNHILRFQILMVTSMKQSVIFTQIHDVRIPCVQLHKMYMNTVKIYAYIWAYTAVRRLPKPLLQSIRSWVSSSPIPHPPFFIASVMPSRHDRLGLPSSRLDPWVNYGWPSLFRHSHHISLILFSTHWVKK